MEFNVYIFEGVTILNRKVTTGDQLIKEIIFDFLKIQLKPQK